LALDESKKSEDYEQKVNGIKILVKQDLLNQFESFNVDYSNSWLGKGFVVKAGVKGSKC
jgi:Fe-S cluster assembly iron-binding protein IscA